jgi:hypothetical protein
VGRGTVIEDGDSVREEGGVLEPHQGEQVAAVDHFGDLQGGAEIAGLPELERLRGEDPEAAVGREGHAAAVPVEGDAVDHLGLLLVEPAQLLLHLIPVHRFIFNK